MKGWSRSLIMMVGATVVALGGYRVGRARADGVPTVSPLIYTGTIDEGGRPIEGMRNVTILLWDAVTGGAVRCSTSAPGTVFSAGQFRVALDATCVAAVRASPDLWAEVLLDGTTFPRMKLGAVPYALEAARASGAAGALDTRIAAVETAARPRQIQLGTPVDWSAMLTSGAGSLAAVPGGPTLTLMAQSSSRYRVCTVVAVDDYPGGRMRVAVTGTGHRILWQPEHYVSVSGATASSMVQPCIYVQLVAGMTYLFSLEASGGSSTFAWRVHGPQPNGLFVAEQLD